MMGLKGFTCTVAAAGVLAALAPDASAQTDEPYYPGYFLGLAAPPDSAAASQSTTYRPSLRSSASLRYAYPRLYTPTSVYTYVDPAVTYPNRTYPFGATYAAPFYTGYYSPSWYTWNNSW